MFFVLGDRTPTQILSLVNDVQMMQQWPLLTLFSKEACLNTWETSQLKNNPLLTISLNRDIKFILQSIV
jgi:hypothetical protein